MRGSISASAWEDTGGGEEGMGSSREVGSITPPPRLRFWNKKPELHEEHPLLRPWGWSSCLY